MITTYELARLSMRPFLPVLEGIVRSKIKKLLRENSSKQPALLDIGGRKSPYSIGLRASITILDLPRQEPFQETLNLGLSQQILVEIRRQRSNIVDVVLEDMTTCTLPSEFFDGVICIEVIEHVRKDQEFLFQIKRVLKPGGWLIITTPNGDYVKNVPLHNNPDHVRHYTKLELMSLLSLYFENAQVNYAVKTDKRYLKGLRSFDYKRPLSLAGTMVSNLINSIQSGRVSSQSVATAKLLALAWKRAQ